MNRRTALQTLSFLTAGAFAPWRETRGGKVAAEPRPAPNDPGRLLLLSAVWEAIDALGEVETLHQDCAGCDNCLFDGPGMLFHLTSYESLLYSEVVWVEAAERQAASERKRRCDFAASGAFDRHPSFRVLVALNGFRDALAEVLERHERCSCQLCQDLGAMHWQMEVYVSVWSSTVPSNLIPEADELAERGLGVNGPAAMRMS
jgi:hypothetical protein